MNRFFTSTFTLSAVAVLAVIAFSFCEMTAAPREYDIAAKVASRYVSVTANAEKIELPAAGPAVYVFNDADKNGFVLVAVDEKDGAIIGYSDCGTIDADNLPANMQDWLSGISPAGLQRAAKTVRTKGVAAAGPLVQTKWYQLEPYNALLPDPGCFTGCVATAMAQIIRFHEYPSKGIGSNTYTSYRPLYHGGEEYLGELSADFSTSVYDWDNMIESYVVEDGRENWTEEQMTAVATLMRDCGIATNMQYSTEESTSYDVDACVAMAEHFGYKAKVYPHFMYSTDEFLRLLCSEIDARRPVLFTGQGSMRGGGGHAFVIDGYDSNGFLHVNWGWNGKADGYYDVGLFNPDGGFYSGLQYFSSFIPADGQAQPFDKPLAILYPIDEQGKSGVFLDAEEMTVDHALPFDVNVMGMVFVSTRAWKGDFALALYDSNGTLVRIISERTLEIPELDCYELSPYPDFRMEVAAGMLNGLQEGFYSIRPVSRTTDSSTSFDWQPVNVSEFGKAISAEIGNDGSVRLSNAKLEEVKLSYVGGVTCPAKVDWFENIEIGLSLQNDSNTPWEGEVTAYLASTSGEDVCLDSKTTIVYDKRTVAIRLAEGLTPEICQPGVYTLKLLVESGGKVVTPANEPEMPTVEVGYDEAKVPGVFVAGITATDQNGAGLDLSRLVLDMTDFDSRINLNIDYRSTIEDAVWQPVDLELSGENEEHTDGISMGSQLMGSSGLASFSIDSFIVFTPGTYNLQLQYTHPVTGELVPVEPESLSRITIVADDGSSVEELSSTEPIETERYDVYGRRIDTPTSGVNIIRMSDGSVRKVIVVNNGNLE